MNEIFGKPNEGVHSHRIFGYALVDIVGTIFIACVLSYYLDTNFLVTLIVLFVVGEGLHYGFGVETAFIRLLREKLKY